jgi:hypothetical protein
MKRLFLLLIVIVASCGSPSEKDAWQGQWEAKWETDKNGYGYEGLPDDYVFEMTGTFDFSGDQVTITANGFDKCIFQTEVSTHTQSWEIRGDTLELQNQPGEIGLQYRVLERTEDKIRLQLVDDIFITLTK